MGVIRQGVPCSAHLSTVRGRVLCLSLMGEEKVPQIRDLLCALPFTLPAVLLLCAQEAWLGF